jgi:hypothetical protein
VLQQKLDNLLQLGLSKQQLVAALKLSWVLLAYIPERLVRMEKVVQQELGAKRQLWVKVLVSRPRAAGCSGDTLRQRAQALVAVSDCGGWLHARLFQSVRWWRPAAAAAADGDSCLELLLNAFHRQVACCKPSTAVLLTLLHYCCTGVWQGGGMQDGRCCTATACHQHCRVAACAGSVAAVRRG